MSKSEGDPSPLGLCSHFQLLTEPLLDVGRCQVPERKMNDQGPCPEAHAVGETNLQLDQVDGFGVACVVKALGSKLYMHHV